MIEITPEMLRRHDRPGPRYTSYPTAVDFSPSFDAQAYEERLMNAAARADAPLSMYVHLPFCEARCSFCACHVVITRDPQVAGVYVDRIAREVELVAARLGERRRLSQYHWGGGTPTHHPPEVLAEIHATLTRHFELLPGAELAVEVDPRVTTRTHLELLADLGFNRLSLGVQDLDPTVQSLIGRDQTLEQTQNLYRTARELRFGSINFDLIYGLPGQTLDTIAATLDQVIAMRPDRLAVYSFAFVPWMRPHQRRLDDALLPDVDLKFGLLAEVVTRLVSAGYHQIGMDHFALPSDELASAASDGTLGRNFMGYTTQRDSEVIALGTSGISDVAGAYAQNHRRLASYYRDVESGSLPIERGYALTEDDRIRRWVITEVMCNGRVDLAECGNRFGIDGVEYFDPELSRLAGGLVQEGMVGISGAVISTSELGRLFVRRLASVFDAHTAQRPTDRPVFSRTV